MLVANAGPVSSRRGLLLDVRVERLAVERRAVVEHDVGPRVMVNEVKSSFGVIDFAS